MTKTKMKIYYTMTKLHIFDEFDKNNITEDDKNTLIKYINAKITDYIVAYNKEDNDEEISTTKYALFVTCTDTLRALMNPSNIHTYIQTLSIPSV